MQISPCLIYNNSFTFRVKVVAAVSWISNPSPYKHHFKIQQTILEQSIFRITLKAVTNTLLLFFEFYNQDKSTWNAEQCNDQW